jgi:hypothetical protein
MGNGMLTWILALWIASMVVLGALIGFVYGKPTGNWRKPTIIGALAAVCLLVGFVQRGTPAIVFLLGFGLALSCVIGRAIAYPRGRAGAGLLLGLLGPFGWLIAAVLPPSAEVQHRRDSEVAEAVEPTAHEADGVGG